MLKMMMRRFQLCLAVALLFGASSALATPMVEFVLQPSLDNDPKDQSSRLVEIWAAQADGVDAAGGINLGFEPYGNVVEIQFVSWGENVLAESSFMLPPDFLPIGNPFGIAAASPTSVEKPLGSFGAGEDFLIAVLRLIVAPAGVSAEGDGPDNGGIGAVDMSLTLGFPASDTQRNRIETNVDDQTSGEDSPVRYLVPEASLLTLAAPLCLALLRRRSR